MLECVAHRLSVKVLERFLMISVVMKLTLGLEEAVSS